MTSQSSADPTTSFGVPPDAERLAVSFGRLVEVIAKLRSPEGCPWDRVQTLSSIKPYTLEETYELLEAIDSDDDEAICEELGDLLLQVVLDAQIAADERRFDLIAVVDRITEKMVLRHPHVFGDQEAETPDDVRAHWDRAKGEEKPDRESVLDGIPQDLPALARAARLTKKAARVGYDFPHRLMLFDKLQEELAELQHELSPDEPLPVIPASVDGEHVPDELVDEASRRDRMEDELGDVLFVIANIARRWGINPEEALRRSNRKFTDRFQAIERGLAGEGINVRDATLPEMEEHYQRAKRNESDSSSRST
jgi:uncharacterized protein YabN with tetrapyrrole methylase and pyrophosphatase domain